MSKYWLTCVEAIAEFGMCDATLRRWSRRKCGPLGRKLQTKPKNGSKFQRLYSRTDLQTLADLPDLVVDGRYEDARGIWRTIPEVFSRFGFTPQSLRKWRKNCVMLGRPLTAKRVWTRRNALWRFLHIWVYLESDLQKIINIQQRSESSFKDGRWLSAAEVVNTQ